MKIPELIELAKRLSKNQEPALHNIQVTKKSDELDDFIHNLEFELKENNVPLNKIKDLCEQANHLPGHPISNFERFIKDLKEL